MTLAAAASCSIFVSAALAQQDQRTVGQKTGDALHDAGNFLTGSSTRPSNPLAPDAEDIRETVKEVTQAALTKGGFDDLIERFVDADRNRLGKDGFSEKDHPQLDGLIAQIQKDWKAKYNQDFKIADKEAVYNSMFASIVQSEIPGSNDARLAADRPAVTDPGQMPARPDNQRVAGGDTNREAGRNIATINVAASHNMPMLMIPMVHEAPDSWKIDVPDSFTVEQLHDNLMKHLTMVKDMKDQWPADPNEAYRAVTHHVLMAVMNTSDTGMNLNQATDNLRNNMPTRNNSNDVNTPSNSTNQGGSNLGR